MSLIELELPNIRLQLRSKKRFFCFFGRTQKLRYTFAKLHNFAEQGTMKKEKRNIDKKYLFVENVPGHWKIGIELYTGIRFDIGNWPNFHLAKIRTLVKINLLKQILATFSIFFFVI